MASDGNRKFGLMVIAAPSGAGKSTLCSHLFRNHPARLALSVSSTSRAPRGSEKHGQEYFFLDSESFQKKIDQGEFAEWALVHGNYYGTSKKMLEDFWAQGKHVLLDIDVQGAESLRKTYPDRCFTVFIAPPSMEELERRLRGRGTETEEAIQRRLANATEEMKHQPKFDLVLVNDDIDRTFRELEEAAVRFMERLEHG